MNSHGIDLVILEYSGFSTQLGQNISIVPNHVSWEIISSYLSEKLVWLYVLCVYALNIFPNVGIRTTELHLHISLVCITSIYVHSGWSDQMETFSASLALCAGNSSVTGEFPSRRPVTWSFGVFSLTCAWINGWVNTREAGDFRRHRAHYDVTVILCAPFTQPPRTLWAMTQREFHHIRKPIFPHPNMLANWKFA